MRASVREGREEAASIIDIADSCSMLILSLSSKEISSFVREGIEKRDLRTMGWLKLLQCRMLRSVRVKFEEGMLLMAIAESCPTSLSSIQRRMRDVFV